MAEIGKRPVILQVLPELASGGVERGTVEIAEGLTREGWTPIVASAGGPMTEELRRINTRHITLPLQSKNPYTIWRNATHLEEIIRTYKVDVIHARSRAPAWSAYLAAQKTRIPFVTTFHGVYGRESGWKQRYNEVMVKGDRVIAVSDFVAEHIRAHYPIDAHRLRVIHRGVDLRKFRPDMVNGHRVMELVQKWHVPDDCPIILMPGRLTRWKGQHVLIDALSRLPNRNFYCLLVGDNSKHPGYGEELERQIAKLNLIGAIRFAGSTPLMATAYGLSDLVISPSIEPEAFGRVAVEAQAMGRIIIASDHGGSRETILPNETGFLVPPNDPAALAESIHRALTMDAESKWQMTGRAMHHVYDYFSTDRMCAATFGVYEDVMRHANGELRHAA